MTQVQLKIILSLSYFILGTVCVLWGAALLGMPYFLIAIGLWFLGCIVVDIFI